MAMKNAVPQGVGRWVRGLVLASVSMGALVLGCSAALASKQSTLLGGGKVAFLLASEDEADGPPGLLVVNADGTDPEMPAHLQGTSLPAWSADGKKVVFTTTNGQNRWAGDIFLMNADGSEKRNLTNSPRWGHSSPSISADGQKIAFTSKASVQSESFRAAVFVVDADGTNLRNLSNSPDTGNRMPAISPNGKWVAFSSDRLYKQPDIPYPREGVIFLVDTEGNNLHPLTSTTGIISYEPYPIPNLDWDPAWSPDGKRIAWSNGGDIWVINVDGTQPHRLTTSWKTGLQKPILSFYSPAWSPDGTKIAMQARLADDDGAPSRGYGFLQKYSICVVDVDGSNLRLVMDHQHASRPRWVPVMDGGLLGPR